MTMIDGRFVPDTEDEVLEVLMNNARDVFGPDLNNDEKAVIRLLYIPVARLLADSQNDLRTVLDSAQLKYAEGRALELLTALIGVRRRPATKSAGTAEFKRETAASVDYTLPRGTKIQTDSVNPVQFETTELATLPAGQTSVSGVPIRAIKSGVRSNVGSNSLTVMTNPPPGIESVTNPEQTTGGTDAEDDDDLRARAKSELSDGMRGTARGIRNQLVKMPTVKSVRLYINDGETTDGAGIPPQHTECVVEGGADQDVGQTIWDSKGAGDGTHGGAHGTAVTVQADIGNGQTHPVDFSRPNVVQIYFDVDLSTNNKYEGDDEVRDAIVEYVGGTITSGADEDGELRVGDDVIYTKVLSAIMSINGVEDVPALTIGKSASPTNSSNESISATTIATADATDGSITITEV
ncbi:baseplate J-like protein [Halorubrum tailed virus 25]|uniref:Baseplate J-like protein n=1 Tax=Halorubrum tailed virus 25 TaxID=2878006 RepID=A0AAE9BY12_9CAUD|nr:baseplate wedge subunit [Halorubrum tailed virus 25]UBF22613.1 baseplate J-like protein [Halorubrum tailed virus 25]